jgi:O-antigen/teichoic acid export membrane protein
MKIAVPVFAAFSLLLAPWGMATLGVALGAILVVLVFCYLLIARWEVAPDIKVSKRGLKLRFKRLPARLKS